MTSATRSEPPRLPLNAESPITAFPGTGPVRPANFRLSIQDVHYARRNRPRGRRCQDMEREFELVDVQEFDLDELDDVIGGVNCM